VEAAVLLQTPAQRAKHRGGHGPKVMQRLVTVVAHAEIHLGEPGQANLLVGVDEQADLHAVAGEEG